MAEAQQNAGKSPIDPEIERRKRRLAKLQADRGTLNAHLEEIAEIIYPNGMGFNGRRTAGEKRLQNVYDSTGIVSNELLAASLHGLATNPASKWFAIRMVDTSLAAIDAVKGWLSDVEKKLYAKMYSPGTNLTPALDEFYLQLGAFGTAVLFMGQTSKGGLLFQSRALSECYIAENGDGVVDTLYRVYTQTVRQIIEDPDFEASPQVKALFAKDKLDDEVIVCHCVEPRPNAKGKKGVKNMAFASIYFEVATAHCLQESGFPEFPYVVARWRKAAGETYGRSCGMAALPDVKMLQVMMKECIKILQKMSNPVRYLRDDGVIGQQRNVPGGINYWRGNPNEGIMLEPTTDKMPITLSEMDNLRNRIRTTFHNDTLQIVDEREMTLGEARMRRVERMRLQGPNIGRLDSEMLGPLIDRVYGILDRLGEIPPSPPEIDGKPVTVEFVSPLANAQKQEQLAGLGQAFEYLAPLGELGARAVAKKLNIDRFVEYLWDVLNNDPDLLNTDEEVEAIDQQEQQQRSMAEAGPMADAANKGAGAVKQLADAQAGGGMDVGKLAAIVAPALQQQARRNGARPS